MSVAGLTPAMVTPPKVSHEACNLLRRYFACMCFSIQAPSHGQIFGLGQVESKRAASLAALKEMQCLQKQIALVKEINQLQCDLKHLIDMKAREDEKSVKVNVVPYTVCHPPAVSIMS